MFKLHLLVSSAAIAFAAATPAFAQQPGISTDEARLRAAINEAEQARNAAYDALRKADAALVMLKSALPAEAAVSPEYKSATVLVSKKPPRAPLKRPVTMPACDASPRERSIGQYMLETEATGKQNKESTYTDREMETNQGINAFVYHCLGLTRATDYESTTNLSAQFTASKGSDAIEAAVTRTARGIERTLVGKERKRGFAATFNRYSIGAFGRTGSNGDATLIDLTTSNFASGVGVLAGYEYGRMAAKSEEDLQKQIHAGIAKARQECVAANSIIDPLTTPDAPSDRPQLALNPLGSCEGDELVKWMAKSKQANQYWASIVSPLWGTIDKPVTFAGVQLRYAFQDLTFRPVIDPRTGAVIVTDLPPSVTIHPEPYSLKLYGGLNRPIMDGEVEAATIGFAASLTYRREVDFIEGTAGKTICTPATAGASFDICSSDQKLAAPYDTKGFVAGIALNLQSRRFWYLPPIAISPRFTYAFDTKRPGIELPFFLLTDADGKLNSGVKYTCRFRGETPEGFELKKTCNVNPFVGTSFEIGKTP